MEEQKLSSSVKVLNISIDYFLKEKKNVLFELFITKSDLVSLFNGIPAFMGYLKWKPSLQDSNSLFLFNA